MKRMLWWKPIVVCLLASCSGRAEGDDAIHQSASLRAGFRGIRWGMNISDCPGMVLAADWGEKQESLKGLRVYERTGDNLTYDNATLQAVGYVFYKSRFITAVVAANGRENWLKVRDALFAEYGKSLNSGNSVERLQWLTEDLAVSLTYDTGTSDMRLRLTYRPLAREFLADNTPLPQQATPEDEPPALVEQSRIQSTIRSTIAADTPNEPKWHRITIPDVGLIDIPPEMEIQRQSIGKLNPFKEADAKTLTIQQAGWNRLDPKTAERYFRLIIETDHLEPGDVSKLGSEIPLSKEDLKELTDTVLSELPAEWRQNVIQTYPAKIVRIGSYPALQTGYKRKGAFSSGPVIVTTYTVPNYDRRHVLTVSYRESEAAVWLKHIPGVLASLRITNVRTP